MVRAFTHDGPGTRRQDWADVVAGVELPLLGLDGFDRVVVVGAHPDDESLGAGGLLALAAACGLQSMLLVATDGEGSHPSSPTHTPEALARRRRTELHDAALTLGLDSSSLVALALPDGRVGEHEDDVVAAIVDAVGDGRGCLLVAPYRADGHPDHEAMGRCAAAAAHRTGATLAEYPVWLWHAGEQRDLPLESMVRLPLPEQARAAKQSAIASHTSQIRPLSSQPGDEVMLSSTVLEHFVVDEELFVLTSAEQAVDDRLDRLHAGDADPWGAESRWYERRKRSLLLAALPRPRFSRALEVGCSTGVLTESLLSRADTLVATDSSPTALDHARERLAPARVAGRADLRLMVAPQEWPEGRFDLVVVSEIGYFLSPAGLDGLVDRVTASLSPTGVLVLCHWRHPVEGWPLDGPEVHRAFARRGVPPVAATYRDPDVEIVVHAGRHEWPDPLR